MSESDEEVLEVSEEFKNLFKGKRFKFEGLSGETEEEYVKLVKEMGAEVSNDARITFMQRSYFEKKKNKSKKDILCNINYIADSVQAGEAIEMKDYIFLPDSRDQLLDDEPLCHAARYMYKTDSCQECYYTKVFCKECAKESIKESLEAANQNKNHIISASESSSEDEIMNSPDQAINDSNKSSKRLMSSDSGQDSNDEEQMNSTCAEKSPLKKKLKNSSNIDNTCHREESPEIDVENDSESNHSQSNDNSVNNSQNEQVEEASSGISGRTRSSMESRILRSMKNGVAETKQDDNLSDNSSDKESNAKNNKHKKSPQKGKRASNSGWITSLKSKPVVKAEPLASSQPEPPEPLSDSLSNIVDNEDNYFKGDKWWLPQHVPDNEKCTVLSCSYEPTNHPGHYPFRKFLSLVEKKILVKYLIMKNAIHNAKGKSIYQNMIKDGYLTHRSWETLRNCFRRTIIKEIEGYELDKNLLNQFLRLRLKNITRVKEEKVKEEK